MSIPGFLFLLTRLEKTREDVEQHWLVPFLPTRTSLIRHGDYTSQICQGKKIFHNPFSIFTHTIGFTLFRLMPAGHSQLLIASMTKMGNSLSLRRISDSLSASMIGLLPLISLGDGNLLNGISTMELNQN